MQNFTFGRKGTNWFLFAFVLLIGTLPSFGQDCPIVGDDDTSETGNQQIFCDSQEAEISDLSATPANGNDVVWYETADSSDPIPETQLLVDGNTYYAGNSDDTCNSRESVTVTIINEPEILGIDSSRMQTNKQSLGGLTICVDDINNPETTVGDLRTDADDIPNLTVNWYYNRTDSDPIDPSTPLQDNTDYYASVTNDFTGCETNRARTRVNLETEPAPTGDEEQIFCASNNPTLGDIVASGENRYFPTQNSVVELSQNTPLEDGETYYLTTVGEFCESVDRLEVTVEIIEFDAGADVSTTLCLAEVQERLAAGEAPQNLFLTLVEDRNLPSDVSFNPSIQSIAGDFNDDPTQTFTTEATFTTEEGCEDIVELEIIVEEDFEAGENNTEGNEVCLSTDVTEQEVEDYLTSLLSEDVDEGTFSNITQITVDIQNGLEGPFNSIYTAGSGECADTAEFEFTVLESPNLEALLEPVADLCNDDIPALVNEIPEDVEALFLENFGENIPEGDFEEGDIQAVINQYNQNNIDTFTATFIANVENGCSEEIELTRTVIEGETANAGNLVYNEDVCTSDQPIDLTSLTEADSFEGTVGGTFSGEGVSNNVFDPSTVEPDTYTITYRVDESLNCVSGSEETTFTIDVIQGPDAGQDISGSLCLSELEEIVLPNLQNPENIIPALFNRFNFNGETGGTVESNLGNDFEEIGQSLFTYYSNPNRDPSITIEGTYTVGDEADECGTDESTFAITIIDGELVDAGQPNSTEICNITIENGRFPSISSVRNYYLDLLDEGVSRNGTFEPTINEIVNWYNNEAEIGIFSTTYTVGSGECQDSVELSVEVLAPEQAIVEVNDENPIICITENEFNLNTLLSENTLEGGIFTGSEFIDANIFDATTAGIGEFEITYSISEETSECVLGEASKSFTINVIDAQEATAEATNQEIDVCVSETSFDLTTALTAGTTPGGSFTLEEEAFEGTSFDVTQEGTYNFTYNISSENAECIQGNANASFTINVTTESFDAGQPNSTEICNITIENGRFPSISSVRNYYLDLLDEGVSRNGTFEPTINEIVNWYNNEAEIGIFSTTYTVGSGECQDSVELSVEVLAPEQAIVEVNDENPIICITENEFNLNTLLSENTLEGGIFTGSEFIDANIFDATTAGIGEFEITYSISEETSECVLGEASKSFTINVIDAQEATAEATNQEIDVCSSETSYNLNDALSDDSTPGGTFFLDGEEFNGNTFDATSVETGEYSFTYTVSSEDSECIEGSATTDFTINVTSETFDAGDDVTFTVCSVGLDPTPTLTEVRNYFLNLLENGIPQNGTFSPRMEEIREVYTAEQIGTFTSTYTVGNGTCADSVELTVVVTDAIEAEVGEIAPQTVCSSDEDIDLFTYLTDDTTTGGTFEGYEDGIFSPSMMGAGSYDVTYTVNEDAPCVEGEASTTFTITVEQGANAGEDMAVTVCSNDGQQDLYDLISADADMDGEFTLEGDVITGGIMDPSAFEAGTYEVIYTVTAEGDECGGDDMSTIIITLSEAPDAPTTGEAIAFCAIDGETAARLEADGTNLTWYSDADLTMMVSEEDLLVDGDYYVTQSSDEGCESEAAVLTVNIVDSPAPTISSNYELCEFDNPTIAALTAEINESGEVTWYDSADSMTALSNNATLTDGTTYYATLISDNGCESSERLAVTVTLEQCAIIPEAITPNDDNKNDTFSIGFLENDYPNFNVTIFNRWGNAVYKGNASTPEWDGTSNQSGSLGDDVLPVGVYFYVIDFNDGSTEPRQGKVYLNR